MSAIWLPKKRIVQPQYPCGIAYSNPLADEIAFVYSGSLPDYELVSGRRFTYTSQAVFGSDADGTYLSNSAQTGPAAEIATWSPLKTSDGAGSGDFTISALVNYPTSAAVSGIVSQRDGGTPYNQVQLTVNGISSSNLSGYWGISTYLAAWREQRSAATYDSAIHLLTAVRQGDTFTLYVDGVVVTNGTATGTGVKDVFAQGSQGFALLGVGEYASSYGATNAKLYGAWGHDRALSAAEVQELAAAPWQVLAPLRYNFIPTVVVAAGGGVTGTLAVTESGDTFAASGTVGHTGTLSVTESADTFAASGTVGHTGTLAVTEDGDTFSATGTVGHVGTMAVTEAGDVFEATGTVGASYPTGTMAVTESPDTFAATGTVGHIGTLAVTEAGDTFSATGVVGHVGTMAVTERGDTFYAEGTAGAVTTVYGRVPRRSKRRFVVTVRGARFIVHEDELEYWLGKQEDEIVEEEVKRLPEPAKRSKKPKVIKKAQSVIKINADDSWIKSLVSEANKRIRDRVIEIQEEEDMIIMALAA